jgi:hypothetical protein
LWHVGQRLDPLQTQLYPSQIGLLAEADQEAGEGQEEFGTGLAGREFHGGAVECLEWRPQAASIVLENRLEQPRIVETDDHGSEQDLVPGGTRSRKRARAPACPCLVSSWRDAVQALPVASREDVARRDVSARLELGHRAVDVALVVWRSGDETAKQGRDLVGVTFVRSHHRQHRVGERHQYVLP